MDSHHPNASYPASSVHTILSNIAASLDAVLRRPEDTPYQVAFGTVGDFLHSNPALTKLNDQEKKIVALPNSGIFYTTAVLLVKLSHTMRCMREFFSSSCMRVYCVALVSSLSPHDCFAYAGPGWALLPTDVYPMTGLP